jgi:hypothetical protein
MLGLRGHRKATADLSTSVAEATCAQDDRSFLGGEIRGFPPLNQKAIQGWGTRPQFSH